MREWGNTGIWLFLITGNGSNDISTKHLSTNNIIILPVPLREL